MNLINIDRIVLVISVVIGIVFLLMAVYLTRVFGYKMNLKDNDRNDPCSECAREIKFKWGAYGVIIEKMKLDLPKALLVGCYVIGGLLLANSLFDLNDIFLQVPVINKIFMWSLSIYTFLTVVHLSVLLETLNKCAGNNCEGFQADERKTGVTGVEAGTEVGVGAGAGAANVGGTNTEEQPVVEDADLADLTDAAAAGVEAGTAAAAAAAAAADPSIFEVCVGPKIISHFNYTNITLLIVTAVIVIVNVLPTYLSKSTNSRKR
jgi:hypothetical protein